MESTIRSLHVDTERTWRGGEQQALYLAQGLQARGHTAELAGHRGCEFARRGREAGLEAHELSLRGELNPLAVAGLVRLLKDRRFQIIHAHTSHAHTLAAIAARLAGGVRCVVSRRVDFAVRGKLPFRRIKYRFGVDRFVAISAAVRDVLIEGGVAAERIRVVPSGIDPQRLTSADPAAIRREFGLEPDVSLVGAVCHFAWHKGLEHLLDAIPSILAQRPGTRFMLAGDGELRAELEARAARVAPAGTILFPGFRGDVPSLLAAFDVVVAPSVMEGLNTTNLDSLALSRPLVAARVGGIPEVVIDGQTGLLVPPGDPEALAAAILRLLEQPELGRRLGAAGRARILERFTNDSMVEGTLEVYRELLRQTGTRRAADA